MINNADVYQLILYVLYTSQYVAIVLDVEVLYRTANNIWDQNSNLLL